MSFPVIKGTNGTNPGASGTSHDVNLPSDISSGDLLLALLSGGNPRTINTPTGWTELFNVSGTEAQLKVVYKVAVGDEGGAVNVTTSTACFLASTAYLISRYIGTPEYGTTNQGSTDVPQAPALSPSWGAKDTLWIVTFAQRRFENAVVTQHPGGYTDPLTNQGPVDSDAGKIVTLRKNENIATQGSAPWICNVAAPTVAAQIAILGDTRAKGNIVTFD